MSPEALIERAPVERVEAPPLTLREATVADAAAVHALIASHLEEGRLLPRTLDEIALHASRFVIAVQPLPEGDRLVGCAELAPLSASVAEVRSLVVDAGLRGFGVGRLMVDALTGRARRAGHGRLCAFAHEPAFFVRQGFSVVPHTWVAEKIARDCCTCPLFRRCGQFALVLDLRRGGASTGLTERTAMHRLDPTSVVAAHG